MSYTSLKKINKIYVEQSRIPNAGLGVFTNIFIKKHEIITQYEGNIVTPLQFELLLQQKNREALMYSLEIPDSENIMVGKTYKIKNMQKCGQYINDVSGIFTKRFDYTQGLQYLDSIDKTNCYIIHQNQNVYIAASRDIEAHQELYLHYGYGYWTYGMELAEEDMDAYLRTLHEGGVSS